MKHYCMLLVLLISTVALAQAGKPAPKVGTEKPAQPAKPAPSASSTGAATELPPSAPVITITGLCATQSAAGGDCKTLITRAQFETLMHAIAPPGQVISPQMKRQVAQQYAQVVLAATTAEKQGLQNTPDAKALIEFSRMQALVRILSASMNEKAMPSDAEAQKYYADNQKRFMQYTFDRILVPIVPGKEGAKPEDMKAFAAQLRERAAKGEDFKTLQKEAFEKAGLKTAPETRIVVQSDSLPPTQQSILQLKAGEVSQPIQDPGGIYIYKLISAEPTPYDKVAPEIKQSLQRQKVQQDSEALLNSVKPELNPQYFGEPAAPAGAPGEPGVRPGTPPPASAPAKPPAGSPPPPKQP